MGYSYEFGLRRYFNKFMAVTGSFGPVVGFLYDGSKESIDYYVGISSSIEISYRLGKNWNLISKGSLITAYPVSPFVNFGLGAKYNF